MAYTYTADTLIYRDTETEQHDIQVWFTVPLKWAEEWCKDNEFEDLEDFDNTYVWDDSYDMYQSALEENVIINEKEYELTNKFFVNIFGE